jgi:predicted AAA+ superfamily ATPase
MLNYVYILELEYLLCIDYDVIMIQRILQKAILEASKTSRIISITGPRQSGKTTLAKYTFPKYEYHNLERPNTLRFAQSDPQSFLQNNDGKHLIIDEIQRFPELFSYLQVMVDEQQIPAQFIITGSQQFALNEKITQSLAGRVANMTLLPLSLEELTNTSKRKNYVDLMFQGFYPAIYDQNLKTAQFYDDYIFTYVERDVRSLKNIGDLTNFQRFLELIAGRVGQVLNLNSLANDIGVSYKTIDAWISVLEASYIVFRLKPYYENLGKRLIKSPKIFFYDTGLLCYLLGIQSPNILRRHFSFGHIFENLVISEVIKHKYNYRNNFGIYYVRDNNKNEVDLVLDGGLSQIGIEIKSSQSFSNDLLSGLDYWHKLPGKKNKLSYLVYAGDHEQKVREHQVTNWQKVHQIINQLD